MCGEMRIHPETASKWRAGSRRMEKTRGIGGVRMSVLALALFVAVPGAGAVQPSSGTEADAAVSADAVVPPVRDRGYVETETMRVAGLRVEGVGEHSAGITPAAMQALADRMLSELADGAAEAQVSIEQLQAVADAITAAYREAGFIVSTAFLPAQTVGEDRIVRIQVLEGRLGQVLVQGAERYRGAAIARPLQGLQGRALHGRELDTALLYARDLPGVSVSSVLQPGENEGETDLVIVAREADRPYTFGVGLNNHGTELTGRYRAQAAVTWNSPLGLGDVFAASYAHAFDPQQSWLGALSYSVPLGLAPGLSAIVGASRSQLEVSTGPFAALEIKGPTSLVYAGADWKFVNREHLQMQGSMRYIRERSRLDALGFPLSDQEFDVAEAGFSMRRIDTRLRGVDLVQASVRTAIDDRSTDPDMITPMRDSDFTVLRGAYTRMQYLTRSQRLYLKLSGQYSDDVLVPMEQFSLGGPHSVRAFAVSEALGDRGYVASLEYHVDAPGFGDKASPFGGRPWRDVLQFELFADQGRVSGASGSLGGSASFSGAGAGLAFRLPAFHELEFRLAVATPTGGRSRASDDDDYRIWSSFGMTF